MSPLTNRQRCRLLREAVAELYAALGQEDTAGAEMDRYVSRTRVSREAQAAVILWHREHGSES